MTTPYILRRLDAIESELANLRQRMAKPAKKNSKPLKLYGLIKGRTFTEREIDDIGRSLFRDAQ